MARAVASRKASQNTPMLKTRVTAVPAALSANPGRTVAWAAMKPDATEVAISPTPTTRISPKLRSQDQGKPGRFSRGTSHTELSAFWIALATPRVPSTVRVTPNTSARPRSRGTT